MPRICASTCSAGVATSASTSFADAPGKGTSTLAIVTLICGSSSRGVTSTAKSPRRNATSASSGVSCESWKNRAMRPEMPMPRSALQLADPEHPYDHLLIDRIGAAALHLAHEVLLEGDLRVVHPLALARPVQVARRNLRQGDEGDDAVAEVGEADGV